MGRLDTIGGSEAFIEVHMQRLRDCNRAGKAECGVAIGNVEVHLLIRGSIIEGNSEGCRGVSSRTSCGEGNRVSIRETYRSAVCTNCRSNTRQGRAAAVV